MSLSLVQLSSFVVFSVFAALCLCALGRSAAASDREPVCQSVGPYALSQLIGGGGMGVVYRAEHAIFKREVALKLVRGDQHPLRRQRFEREAEVLRRVSHPNVVAVYDHGQTSDARPYLAMELLEGRDLEELVAERGAQEPAFVVHILVQVCRAMIAIHDAGFVHCDIKPANIFLSRSGSDDEVKVLDFGLAKSLGAESQSDEGRFIAGSPYNMAPECFTDPGCVGPQADLYALGCVAYTLLSGEPVFTGDSIAVLAAKHLYAEPRPIHEQSVFAISAELATLISQCLAKSQGARPASARALHDALLKCPEAWGGTIEGRMPIAG